MLTEIVDTPMTIGTSAPAPSSQAVSASRRPLAPGAARCERRTAASATQSAPIMVTIPTVAVEVWASTGAATAAASATSGCVPPVREHGADGDRRGDAAEDDRVVGEEAGGGGSGEGHERGDAGEADLAPTAIGDHPAGTEERRRQRQARVDLVDRAGDERGGGEPDQRDAGGHLGDGGDGGDGVPPERVLADGEGRELDCQERRREGDARAAGARIGGEPRGGDTGSRDDRGDDHEVALLAAPADDGDGAGREHGRDGRGSRVTLGREAEALEHAGAGRDARSIERAARGQPGDARPPEGGAGRSGGWRPRAGDAGQDEGHG